MKTNERLMVEQYVTTKKMNERQARRFRLTCKEIGFTYAVLLKDYNPVPHAACSRHLSLMVGSTSDKIWNWHREMADYFIMLQKQS